MMDSDPVSGLIVSDFNAQNLAGLLSNSPEPPRVTFGTAPFGQVMQTLTDPSMQCWQSRPEVVIVWTRPQAVLPTFQQLLENARPVPIDLSVEVDAFTDAIRAATQRSRLVFVPTWTLPAFERGLGLIDLKSEHGLARQLALANLRLIENLQSVPNAYPLEAGRWMALAGAENAHNPKLWYLGKIGFGSQVFQQAALDIQAAIQAAGGSARKLVIVDLDETLWGGIVGDLGWEHIRLGGHDALGEAFIGFQRGLKALKNRGVLLAIVSKNDETIALEAIRRHPEMVLRLEDFAGWKINWSDKAANVQALVAELNLGLQSAVFIDDNPTERSRVRQALPEVLVPEWPEDKLYFRRALKSLTCFDTLSITAEDLGRTRQYATDRERAAARQQSQSVDDWLRSLETRVIVEPLSAANLPRTAQLLNKTNQMNLATRRMTEPELQAWAAVPGRQVWTFRVQDRFGDSGLTGIGSLELDGDSARIADFVLSCRVMGRRVEETMLSHLSAAAAMLGARRLEATYSPTAKNAVCLAFWRDRSAFAEDQSGKVFRRELAEPYPQPDGIEVILGES
jgi:FkbH-like protein